MKKLLIFGDSFAEDDLQQFWTGHPIYHEYRKHKNWHWVVKNSGLYDEIECHAIGGSDLWSQYLLFLKYYSGVEDVLWFETTFGRLSSPDGKDHYTNLNCIDMRLYELLHGRLKGRDLETVERLQAARNYFLYLQRDDLDKFTHDSIIKEIYKKCPKVQMIPCFEQSTSCTKSNNNLNTINFLELDGFNINYGELVKTHWDIRRNHMTEENSLILGNQIVKLLTTGIDIDYSLFLKPTPDQISKYFIAHT